MKKNVNMLQNKIGKPIIKMAIHGTYKLIGSNEKRGLHYTSDYDILDDLKGKASTIAKHFMSLNFKNIYFMDFKAGIDKDEEGNKLRWSESELKKGYKLLKNGSKKTLKQAITEPMIIKLDVIIPVGNTFAEVSENYNYKNKKIKKEEIIKALETDIEKYSVSNSMKALKRFYSVIVLEKGHKDKIHKLEVFFNDEIGLVNKIANDLELLEILTDKHNIPFTDIENNCQMLKEKSATTKLIPTKTILLFNKINSKNYKTIIKQIIDNLRNIINPIAKSFLKKIS